MDTLKIGGIKVIGIKAPPEDQQTIKPERAARFGFAAPTGARSEG